MASPAPGFLPMALATRLPSSSSPWSCGRGGQAEAQGPPVEPLGRLLRQGKALLWFFSAISVYCPTQSPATGVAGLYWCGWHCGQLKWPRRADPSFLQRGASCQSAAAAPACWAVRGRNGLGPGNWVMSLRSASAPQSMLGGGRGLRAGVHVVTSPGSEPRLRPVPTVTSLLWLLWSPCFLPQSGQHIHYSVTGLGMEGKVKILT